MLCLALILKLAQTQLLSFHTELSSVELPGHGKEELDGAVLPDCSTGECCFVSRRL